MSRGKIKEYEDIKIESFEFPNMGVCTANGRKVLVKNAIPGQVVDIRVKKAKKGDKGTVINIKEKSNIEIEPKCVDFGLCGGCTFQHIEYEEELKIKEKVVLNLFEKNNLEVGEYLGIEKSPKENEYRNKMEYSFGDETKGGELALGMRKRNSYYEVVTSKKCNIIDEDYRKILNITLDFFKKTKETFYHKNNEAGGLRHLLVRKGQFSNELIVGLVTKYGLDKEMLEDFKNVILESNIESEIKGIYNIVNKGLADVVVADELNVLYGETFFYEEILGLKFKINIFSFFQTNSSGAEKLYGKVNDFIGDTKDKIIFDLYCGTGTIAQIVSKCAKKVIGVEIIEEAIEDAKENCKINNISNVEFICGDVLKVIVDIKDKPDIIILDPPRNGIQEKALNKIIDYGVENIIYVSCKPTSLIRDLKILSQKGYKVKKLAIQDMFPKTYHMETVVLLEKNL